MLIFRAWATCGLAEFHVANAYPTGKPNRYGIHKQHNDLLHVSMFSHYGHRSIFPIIH